MATPGFLEMQLDPRLSQGSKGGLSYLTTVVSNPSNIETRFSQRSRGYWKLSINLEDRSKVQMSAIQQFFSAVQGKAWGWRFRNWREYQVTNEPLIYTSGTTAQLSRLRSVGAGLGSQEKVLIRKPDMTTPITLTMDGSNYPSAGNWTLDTTTGIVTFNSNMSSHVFTWSGQYDTPCRFDVDDSDIEWQDFDVFAWSQLNVMEIQV